MTFVLGAFILYDRSWFFAEFIAIPKVNGSATVALTRNGRTLLDHIDVASTTDAMKSYTIWIIVLGELVMSDIGVR